MALPSQTLEQGTMNFLQACGLRVHRPNSRQYTAVVPSLPELRVVFQRAADIYANVQQNTVDFGITGLDMLSEMRQDGDDIAIVIPELGYGKCGLELAIPQSWVDVVTVADMAELASQMKSSGRELRIATKFPNLTTQYLHSKGIHYFSIVQGAGAMESFPSRGFADIISDIVETGTTLKENRLKLLNDATILKSQACMIANRKVLLRDKEKLEVVRTVLEFIEAHRRAEPHYQVTAHLRGSSPEHVARHIYAHSDMVELEGPIVSKVYGRRGEDDLYAVTVLVNSKSLLKAVDHLRKAGGIGVAAVPTEYIFIDKCRTYEALLELLKREP